MPGAGGSQDRRELTLPVGPYVEERAHSPSWLRRDIVRVAALAVGINSLLAINAPNRGLPWPPAGALAVVAALLLVPSLWIIVWALRGSPDLRPERTFVVAATAANFVALLTGRDVTAASGTSFLNASTIIGACLAAVSFEALRVGVGWVAALGVGYAAVRAAGVGWPIGLLEATVAMLGSLSVGLFARALGAAFARLATVEEERVRARDAALRREQADGSRLEWDRLVHDKVLGALILASRSSSFATLDTARELAGDALRALGVIDGSPSRSSSLTVVGERVGVRVTGPDSLPAGLPDDVQAAFMAALGEVLINVRRHAGVEAATIEVSGDRNALVVRVHDEGVGFDASKPTGRFGVDQSIPGHMAMVGGTARVDSVPGHGTTVTLSWQAEPAPLGDVSVPSGIDWKVGGISVLATVPPLWVLLHAALGLTALRQLWPNAKLGWPLVIWVCMAALLAGVVLAGRPGRVAAVSALALSTLAVGTLAAVTPAAPAADWALWFVGASLPIPIVFVLTGREWAAWLYSGLTPLALLIGLSAHAGPGARSVPGAFVSPVLVTVAAVMATRGLRRAHQEMLRASDELALLARAERADTLAAQASSQRREELSRDVIPLLERVWRHEIFDADDRAAAAIAEAAARDRLLAPNLVDDEVARAAGLARARGARVTLRTSRTSETSAAPPAFRRAIATALGACGPGSVATIQWHPDQQSAATIVLSGPIGVDAGALVAALDDVPHVLEVDGDEIWLSLSRDGAGTSPEHAT